MYEPNAENGTLRVPLIFQRIVFSWRVLYSTFDVPNFYSRIKVLLHLKLINQPTFETN